MHSESSVDFSKVSCVHGGDGARMQHWSLLHMIFSFFSFSVGSLCMSQDSRWQTKANASMGWSTTVVALLSSIFFALHFFFFCLMSHVQSFWFFPYSLLRSSCVPICFSLPFSLSQFLITNGPFLSTFFLFHLFAEWNCIFSDALCLRIIFRLFMFVVFSSLPLYVCRGV